MRMKNYFRFLLNLSSKFWRASFSPSATLDLWARLLLPPAIPMPPPRAAFCSWEILILEFVQLIIYLFLFFGGCWFVPDLNFLFKLNWWSIALPLDQTFPLANFLFCFNAPRAFSECVFFIVCKMRADRWPWQAFDLLPSKVIFSSKSRGSD